MRQARQMCQKKYLDKVRASFDPLSILQGDARATTTNTQNVNRKPRLGEFDAIWQFEILGRKF